MLRTFATRSMRCLRLVAMGSNLSFIAYAWTMRLWPILLPHAILLPLNACRLRQIEAARRAGREPA
ncbi:hypothetical protein M0638_07285 [Roseomonas sp. NAR14]|uniref:Uncharacterized protein n=1 Tax=Roseomonas acroporae TaxID=2937791 RepID=A0A9X1Y6U2_9PROT|nr:hypothetical protein [Roseomonas acroporae]MCK8784178.1 hypothetical protein [Roseomonas acroporae]